MESTRRALLISSFLEETWITAIQPTALETLKIIVKEVSTRQEPPKPAALGTLVQGGAQSGQRKSEDNLPALLSKVEEAGYIQKQHGRCHLTADMQEGRGLLFLLQESSPPWLASFT